MLQALARQRGASGGAADQEAVRALIAGRPYQVAARAAGRTSSSK